MVAIVEDHEIEDILEELEQILDELGYVALVEQERRAAQAVVQWRRPRRTELAQAVGA